MKIFPWRRKDPFFTEEEREQMVKAIQVAEQKTSGEVRVFIESKCRYVDALDRAKEIFYKLRMFETKERNATLIYVAVKDHQAAVFGDEGIHQKVGQQYWKDEVEKMMVHFKKHHLADGMLQVIHDLGEALQFYFPYEREIDKNELPDEIVFGR